MFLRTALRLFMKRHNFHSFLIHTLLNADRYHSGMRKTYISAPKFAVLGKAVPAYIWKQEGEPCDTKLVLFFIFYRGISADEADCVRHDHGAV